ncbi:glycosyltransferase [Lentzea sp. NPDC051213]|uniref:glycosyltransferase n=1 Tax=Lentzea sp. NPDC051213 TaxID=3364126 RepID=UPI003791AB83
MSTGTFTAVVPAHNEAATIAETVRSCLDQTLPADQVIVVADNCTDDTAALAAAAGATVIEGKAGSKAAAQNLALPLVDSEFVLALDADAVLAPDAAERMVATLRAGHVGTCAAALPKDTATVYSRYRTLYHAVANRWIRPLQDVLGRQLVLSGMANLHRTDVLREMGGYPDDVITEDFNLTWALHRAGHRVAFTPDALVYVQEPTSLRELLSQTHRWTAGFAQSMVKHRAPLLDARSFLVVGSQVWDAFFSGFAVLSLVPFVVRNGLAGLTNWWGLLWAVFMVVTMVVAAGQVGIRTTVRCLPAWLALQTLIGLLTLWWLVREWLLGVSLTTWTGRHGNKAALTAMSRRRVAVLCGLGTAALATFLISSA